MVYIFIVIYFIAHFVGAVVYVAKVFQWLPLVLLKIRGQTKVEFFCCLRIVLMAEQRFFCETERDSNHLPTFSFSVRTVSYGSWFSFIHERRRVIRAIKRRKTPPLTYNTSVELGFEKVPVLNVIYFRRVTTQKQYSHEISGILPKLTSNHPWHWTYGTPQGIFCKR